MVCYNVQALQTSAHNHLFAAQSSLISFQQPPGQIANFATTALLQQATHVLGSIKGAPGLRR